MNKRAFTLVEIIVCISIIAVVGIVIGVNSDKIFGGEKTKEDVVTTIISAAEVYTDSNSEIIDMIYQKGFVKLTIGELKNGGYLTDNILDENGVIIPDDKPVLVTLNEDGLLDIIYEKDDSEQGYMINNSLTIAYGDNFKCDYYVGNTGGLIFYDNKENNISSEFNLVSSITDNKQYSCDNTTVNGNKAGKYDVKYRYRIDGVTRTKERVVEVLDVFEYFINTDNFVDKQHYLDETKNVLYTTNNDYDLKISSNYDGEPIDLVYEIIYKDGTSTKQLSNTFNDLVEGDYTFKIYVSDKQEDYSKNEEGLLAKTDFVITETFNLTIKRVSDLDINVEFRDSSNDIIEGGKWNTGKKVIVTTSNEEFVNGKYYKLDEQTEFSEIKDEVIKVPSKKIIIKVIDILGRELKKEYDINIDVVPDAPTVSQGTSDKYTFTKTFNIKFPQSTLSESTYYYYLGNSISESEGNKFSSESLTVSGENISGDSAKYLYLRTCNKAACSDWKYYNAYISKNVKDFNGCNFDSKKTCYFIGEQTNNYVSYGGKTWRIYKITSGKLGLIMDNSYTTAAYGQVGHCTTYRNGKQGCCNSGRYLYTHLGDTDRTDYSSYGFTNNTMGNILSNIELDGISSYSKSLLEKFSSGSATVYFGLLSKNDYMNVANCSSDLVCQYASTNYIKKNKDAFWLVDLSKNFNGDRGDYNVDREAKAYTYSVDSRGLLISNVGSRAYLGNINTTKLSVRPIVQIKDSAKIISGTGTKTNPYILGGA